MIEEGNFKLIINLKEVGHLYSLFKETLVKESWEKK